MIELTSKNLRMRLVEESDAAFILSLRQDERYNTFLSKVEGDVEQQAQWIRSYKIDESQNKQFYFIIERLDGTPCGTVRIYDIRDGSFCWGSWILNQDKPRFAAVESALLIYEFGFRIMNYKRSHFEVVKGNDKVINFHKKFGAKQISEDENHFYFEIFPESIVHIKSKFKAQLG
ncbi:MAG: GNAT family N-acetyltransferase [Shewanella sp.]|nr:GNAT family N-acetyltransferase [Shewanella sp.]